MNSFVRSPKCPWCRKEIKRVLRGGDIFEHTCGKPVMVLAPTKRGERLRVEKFNPKGGK